MATARGLAFSTSWEGIDVLDLRIDRLIDIASVDEITQALMPGAELIRDRWKEKVPVSTGRYHDNIRVEIGDERLFGIPSIDILTDAVNEDGYPYPEALEFGTSTMPAQPSAIPAFDESVDEAIEMAVARLDALVVKALAR